MDSYVVRIYRRDPDEPSAIIGLVEVVDTGEVKKFASGKELTDIFCSGKKTRERGGKKDAAGSKIP